MFDFNNLEITTKQIYTSLQSEDRRKRKKIICDLHECFIKCSEDNVQFLNVFDSVRSKLWEAVNDQAEVVRDCTIDMLLEVFENIPCENKYLEEIMPIILHRLGDHEQREQSEEIRLKLLEFLNLICQRFEEHLELYISEIINVLNITLTDKYSKIKQESAKCCIILSDMKCQSMYEKSFTLAKPIISNFKHNHSMTRVLSINALCAILREANWKTIESQFIFGSLGEKLFDDSPAVRLAVVKLIGSWLVSLRDRYSYFGRLVPLMLSCLVDDQVEVAAAAHNLWNSAGCQYLNENEQELKDKLDFLEEKPEHYPKGVERPNLGCCTLVTRNVYQMTPALVRELADWQPDVCIKAGALMSLMILHAEGGITQHLENILQAMYRVADPKATSVPPQCRSYIEKGAEYLAYFIPASTWTQIVFPVIETEATPGNLFILAAILRGTCKKDMEPYTDKLTEMLADPNICESINENMLLETLKCCRALLDNVTELSEFATRNLFITIYFVTATTSFNAEQEPLTKAGKDCLELLAKKSNLSGESIIKKHAILLMTKIMKTVNCWSIVHPHFRLLQFLLADPEVNWFSEEKTVRSLLCESIPLDRGDVQVKGHLLTNLAGIFENKKLNSKIGDEAHKTFALDILKDIIVPNLTWRAGLSAEKLRTIVLSCLHLILEQTNERDIPCSLLIPSIISAVKDSPTANRALALQSLNNIIQSAVAQSCFTYEVFAVVYQQVMERLDDVDNEVRGAAIETLNTILLHIPTEMCEETHNAVFTHISTTLLPYLDDENTALAQAVSDALKLLSKRAPVGTRKKLESGVQLLRNQHLCKEIIDSIAIVSSN